MSWTDGEERTFIVTSVAGVEVEDYVALRANVNGTYKLIYGTVIEINAQAPSLKILIDHTENE